METLTTRPANTGDLADVLSLYPMAFPDEDLVPLVKGLCSASVGAIHLVTENDTGIIGHISFTPCLVEGWSDPVSMLAPLAVHPDQQRRGVGKGLIEAGMQNLRHDGVAMVFVLGDPAYYGRHGFVQENAVAPPYDIPDEWRSAWQSQTLGISKPAPAVLQVPAVWQDPTLWGP